MPRPRNAAQLDAQVARLTPAVKAVIAQGGPAVAALWKATVTREPAVTELLLHLGPITAVPLPERKAVRAASGCNGAGGDVWEGANYYLANSVWVFKLQVNSNGWCGNGTNITSATYGSEYNSSGVGVCLTGNFTSLSWVHYWTEASIYEYNEDGVGVSGICDTLGSANYHTWIDYYGNLYWTGGL